jgi:hypothetical protein
MRRFFYFARNAENLRLLLEWIFRRSIGDGRTVSQFACVLLKKGRVLKKRHNRLLYVFISLVAVVGFILQSVSISGHT